MSSPESRRTEWLAFVDQGLVSGARFLTTLLIGRLAGPDELGLYTLAFFALVLSVSAQEALVTTPFAVFRPAAEDAPGYARRALGLQARVGVAAAALVLAAAAMAWISSPGHGTERVLVCLGLLVPAVVVRHFARRFELAHLRVPAAVALDGCAAAIQLGALGVLAWSGRLSAVTALAAVGLAAGATAGLWWRVRSREFASSSPGLEAELRRHWSFGRWLFASQVTQALHSYAVLWLAAWLLGPREAGIYAACYSLLLFVNPLLLGMTSYLWPAAAVAAVEGPTLVGRAVLRSGRPMLALMTVFAGALWWAAEPALALLYGPAYAGSGSVAAMLGLCAPALAGSAACGGGLAALRRTDRIFLGHAAGLAVTLAAAIPALSSLSLVGGAAAAVAGAWTTMAAHVAFLRREVGAA